MRRLVVKLGSSVVADGDGAPRMDVLARVCDQLAHQHRDGAEVIVVTSGAIARGMRVMELPQRPNSIGALQAASAVGQGKLYRIYDELLRERDVTSAQVLLTFFDMSARTHYLNARQTLSTLLEWRVLPVINENDTTATDEISFGDNDFLRPGGGARRRRRADPADRHRRAVHSRSAAAPRRTHRRRGQRLRRAR